MPYFFSIGQSAGPTRSMAEKPISFTVLHNASTDRKEYVHLQTEWLILPLSGATYLFLDSAIETAGAANIAVLPATIFFNIRLRDG